MGKLKASGRKAKSEDSRKQVNSKSRAIEKTKDRITREQKEKSYRETEATDSEVDDVPEVEPEAESPMDSGSDFKVDSDSSGSEYGKKKSKSKGKKAPSPAKGKRQAKQTSSSSPKKGGRGRGRALKAPPKSSRNGKKTAHGECSEDESSPSDQSDDGCPPPVKIPKTKNKPTTSSKRGQASKKSSAFSDEDAAPPRRGGRQRTMMKYRDSDDEGSDEGDKYIPGATKAAKKPTTSSGRGRKPAAAKATSAKKSDATSEDDDKSASEGEAEVKVVSKMSTAKESDEGSESDEKNKHFPRKAVATPKNAESEKSDDDDEIYKKPAPKKGARPVARKGATKKPAKADSDSGESGEDEASILLKKAPIGRKPTAAATATLKESESEESESEETSPLPKKAGLFDEIKIKVDKTETDSDSALSNDADNSKSDDKETSAEVKNNVPKARNGDGDAEDDLGSVGSHDGSEGSKSKTLKNRTDTDFSEINFSSDKKAPSGEEWNFKIACWNVSGIKSWVSKNGLEYVKRESPDVLCLQEVKCTEKTAPAEVKAVDGYPHSFWNYSASPGQSGVAVFSKKEPKDVSYGIPAKDEDSAEDQEFKEMFNKEGRLIVAEFEEFILFNAYVPNSGRGTTDATHSKPYPGRIINGERPGWDKIFREYIKAKERVKPVIVVGDLNVAREPIDLANPNTNASTAGFTKEERESMTQLLEDTGLFDSFRSLYPKQTGAYTYWSYMHNSRAKNIGWRLDYFLLSEKLRSALCENLIRSQVYGSDHCPIVLFAHI